jgi:hypothetical protein
MQLDQPSVKKVRGGWRVYVPRDSGEVFEYRYPYEAQARFFAAVFALGPEKLPPPVAVRSPKKAQPTEAPRAPRWSRPRVELFSS